MWGNTRGWIISAAIAVVMLGLMGLLQWSGTAPSSMTPAFAADAKNLAPLELDPSPETVLAMTDEGDVAEKYQEAIGLYDPKIYDRVSPLSLDEMPALEPIVEVTRYRQMRLFSREKRAPEVINFQREKTTIEILRKLGEACATKALMLKAKDDKDGARRYAEAAFALGAKMYRERVVYEELDAGFALMGAGAQVLATLAKEEGDTPRAAACMAVDEARKKLMVSRINDLHKITKTIDGTISATRAGDVFALAERSQERLWRIEACFQLARIHRFVGDNGRGADQRYAQMLLRRLADNDSDPLVKLAATKARDITDVEYNTQ
jgi:hypothetical protein